MEVILLEGVEYIKANVAAKRFKYTSDYIGQLCRGKKIDAKLVGRTWYVNPLSITTHKKEKLVKNAANSEIKKALHVKADNTVSTIDIQSVPRKATAKILEKSHHSGHFNHFAKHIDWKPIKYKEDNTDLLPNLGSVPERSTKLKVDIVGAQKVEVEETTKDAKMYAESLPEVSMTGSLKVHSLDEKFNEVFDNKPENIAIPDDIEEINESDEMITRPSAIDPGEKVSIHKSNRRPVPSSAEAREITEKDALYQVEIHEVKPFTSFAPQVVRQKARMRQETVVTKEVAPAFSVVKWILFLLLTGLLSSLVFCLDLNIYSTSSEYDWGIIFSIPSLKF